MSDALNDYLKDKTTPSNIYILIKMCSNYQPKTSGFLLKEEFKLNQRCKEFTINIDQPKPHISGTMTDISSGFKESKLDDANFAWYQSKVCLKGFKDTKEQGISMFSSLLEYYTIADAYKLSSNDNTFSSMNCS